MTDCNPTEQERRQALLEHAYVLDGRDDPAHPHHCTYTALAETDEGCSLARLFHLDLILKPKSKQCAGRG
jgi:hypothetical protein